MAIETTFKSGFVSLIGRPNTGKSTLLNRFVGQKISIVTPKPQTTRHRIMGIWHGDSAQIVFLDTPGIHEPTRRLNQRMVKAALKTLAECDLILVMVDSTERSAKDEDLMPDLKAVRQPVFLVINKIDLISKLKILKLIGMYKDRFPYKEIIPVSALTGENCTDLIQTIIHYLPYDHPLYPEDMITDQTQRFATAELIREKLILLTRQEIPYACAVVIDDMAIEPKSDLVRIMATIMVEKESQKGIIIGNRGGMLKEIGQRARKEIEHLLGKHVYMEVWVKVAQNWRNNENRLKQIGY